MCEQRKSHKAAEALDWDEAMSLIERLYDDRRYRDSLLIACGCYMGLRISDILTLKWRDICSSKQISLTEKKTSKQRVMKINRNLRLHADKCRNMLGNPSDTAFVFAGQQYGGRYPITRQRAAQILQEVKVTYGIKSAEIFSTHSLRKSFGRRVWDNAIASGKDAEFTLMLLKDIFHHSSVRITQRYLGIRKDEILSVYDSL